MYVDPIFGDDELAWLSNPLRVGPVAQRPLADYPAVNFPDPVPPHNNGNGVLQHAPYSFRTLTRARGAMAWIDETFFKDPAGARTSLPWIHIDGGGEPSGRRVRWIVVHCLPGLYGPTTEVDPASQLRFNGETFPVRLPRGVSLQGASALDTIFDARLGSTSIIETGQYVDGFGSAAQPAYFIDGLTIRNARSNRMGPGDATSRNNTGVAIYAATVTSADPQQLPLTISNCFLVDNTIGIALETGAVTTPENQNRPIVIHNTFAYNRVGLWNGYRFGGALGNAGGTIVTVLNNIFDTRHPDPATDGNQSQRSPFQGIHPHDLTVSATVPAIPGVAAQSFNTWHTGRENSTVPPSVDIVNFPAPSIRPPFFFPQPPPRVDIGPYMGTTIRPRGTLYVADAFRASPFTPDLSPHDLRLAPHTAVDPTLINPSNPITEHNPLVDKGIDAGEGFSSLISITMENGTILTDQPGFTPIAQHIPPADPVIYDPDRFHCWDFDAEGFGNPRIRRGFDASCLTPIPPGHFGFADLGADELDGLIIAGYVPSTRMFAVLPTVPVTTQTTVYFFNLRGATYPRPVFAGLVGEVFNWWQHVRDGAMASDAVTVRTPTMALYSSNYTDATTVPPGGVTPSWRGLPIATGSVTVPPGLPGGNNLKPPIMRNLECDFSPSLMTDWRPLWRGWFDRVPTSQIHPDVYVASPWYGDPTYCVDLAQGLTNDNFHCYRNPSHPNAMFKSGLIEGMTNPPGAYWNGSGVNCGSLPSYLMPGLPTLVFGPYPTCASPVITIGAWGFGNDAPCGPDQLPMILPWQGVRYDCQHAQVGGGSPYTTNLQTFLSVIGETSFEFASDANAIVQQSAYAGPRAARRDALPPDVRDLEAVGRLVGQRRWWSR